LLVLERLFDRTQAVRAFRMAHRREVIEAGGMTDEERGHRSGLTRLFMAANPFTALALWVEAHSFRWPDRVGHEEIDLQGLARIGAVLIEIGDAFARKKRIVDEEMPG